MLADRLSTAALVVAHPDDEILWFSSLLDQISHVYICYLDAPGQDACTRGRRAVAKRFPLDNVSFLGLTESVPFRGADWRDPVETAAGLELSRRPGVLPGFDPERYLANFPVLVQTLRERLAAYTTVVTHNPWGEYGHEEHVQVHRAVEAVRAELGFELWYSNYCSDRSYPLMLRHIEGRRSDCETFPTNLPLAREIELLYRENDCWTWPFDDYAYFRNEAFISAEPTPSVMPRGSTMSLNYIRLIDVEPARPNHESKSRARKLFRRGLRWLRSPTLK
jgi:LmbE family N-acetylglucosaminyl deacetylase